MARPRTTSSALLMRASRTRVHSAIAATGDAAHLPAERVGIRPGHAAQRLAERPCVQRVDPIHPAAVRDHLAVQMVDEHRVVRLGVAQDERDGTGCHRPREQALDEGGLAGAGLAEDEHARVGDEAGAHPRQRVQADDFAP